MTKSAGEIAVGAFSIVKGASAVVNGIKTIGIGAAGAVAGIGPTAGASVSFGGAVAFAGAGQVALGGAAVGAGFAAVSDGIDNFKESLNEFRADSGKANKSGAKADYGKKLEYVFGNATGSKHNIDRSIAMEKQLNSIGIFDNKVGREIVQDNLTKAFNDPSSILKVQDDGRIVRESLLSGPNGLVKVESIWEDAKLITAQIFGGK